MGSKNSKLADHEYHEIGNEELNAESPRFEVRFVKRFAEFFVCQIPNAKCDFPENFRFWTEFIR